MIAGKRMTMVVKARKQQEQQKKQEITLEMVRKKLESIGIIINVERLMKE